MTDETLEDILEEIDVIGDMLKRKMGKKRFDAALDRIADEKE